MNEFLHIKRIEEGEIDALAEYFSKYAELPPCNSTIPQKWRGFLKVLEESYGQEWEH